jgi:hypothetical protein
VPGKATIGSNQKVDRPAQSRGTRGQVIDAVTGHEAGATINAELIPEVLSKLIAYGFGVGSDAISGSAGTGFLHTLTPKNTLTSVSVEVDNDISSQLLARQVVGNQVDQWTIRGQAQALATFEAQLIGIREITPATPGLPSNPTPTISTLQPMDFSLLAATYKGSSTTQLEDLTLTLMNKVQRVFTNNQQLYASRVVATGREVQVQTTLDFLDTVFYTDWGGRPLRVGGDTCRCERQTPPSPAASKTVRTGSNCGFDSPRASATSSPTSSRTTASTAAHSPATRRPTAASRCAAGSPSSTVPPSASCAPAGACRRPLTSLSTSHSTRNPAPGWTSASPRS